MKIFLLIFSSVALFSRARKEECESFYDYVCKKGEGSYESHFETLNKRSEAIEEMALLDMNVPMKACLEEFGKQSSFKSSFVGKDHRNRSSFSFSYPYVVSKTVNAIRKSLFPIKITMTKRLDENIPCVDFAPEEKWPTSGSEIASFVSRYDGSEGVEEMNGFVSEVILKSIESYKSSDRKKEERTDDDDRSFFSFYVSRYANLKNASKFWNDVTVALFGDLVNDDFCVHFNGYEDYYTFWERRLTSSTEVVDLSVEYAKDVIFGRFDDREAYDDAFRHRACSDLVKKTFPSTYGSLYLKYGGFTEAHRKQIISTLDGLKKTMISMVSRSGHLSLRYKNFIEKKLDAISAYVLTTAPNSDLETPCVSATSWDEATNCATYAFSNRYDEIFGNTDVGIVNAWYDPTRNEITVPAGILRWPVFSLVQTTTTTSEADNFTKCDPQFGEQYPMLGMILAHELGHALDTDGLCWDFEGNYDANESSSFCSESNVPYMVKHGVRCLEKDYGHPCNSHDGYGIRTINEDIADQLGLTVSYETFSSVVNCEGFRLETKRDFFRKYASLWCEGKPNRRKLSSSSFKSFFRSRNISAGFFDVFSKEIAECEKSISDVHALPKHRVNKTLRQIAEFSKTFGCEAGDVMNKENPCLIY